MPWFCRPSAMSKHCMIFLENANVIGIEPVVACIDGKDPYEGSHIFVPFKDYSNKYFAAAIRRIFPDIINQPDIYNFGTRQIASKKLLNSIDFSDIKAIHSVSYPCSSHLLAADIAKATGLPWIAQFYDPWTDNPYRSIKYGWFKKRDYLMEKIVADNAKAIIHTNDIIRNIWIERYGEKIAHKSWILPLSYSKQQIEKINAINRKKENDNKQIVISYIGKLFHDRNLKDIIDALNLIKHESNDYLSDIKIRIIGEISNQDIYNIKKNGMDHVFEIIGYLPQDKLDKYYYDSDAFLVIDSPQSQNVFFPSKLLDYFIWKRMIIGVTPNVGITNRLLQESRNMLFENGDIEGIASFFKKIILDRQALNGFDEEYYLNFAPEILCSKYQSIINKIIP